MGTRCPTCNREYDVSETLDKRLWRYLCVCEEKQSCGKCRYRATHLVDNTYRCDKHGVDPEDRGEDQPEGAQTLCYIGASGTHQLPHTTPCVLGGPASEWYDTPGATTSADPDGKRSSLRFARPGQLIWIQSHLRGDTDERWYAFEVTR